MATFVQGLEHRHKLELPESVDSRRLAMIHTPGIMRLDSTMRALLLFIVLLTDQLWRDFRDRVQCDLDAMS